MNFLTSNYRTHIKAEIAKGWLSMPEDFTSLAPEYVKPSDVISLDNGSYAIRSEGGLVLKQLSIWKIRGKAERPRGSKYKFYQASVKREGKKIAMSRCMLTGHIVSINKLKWRRIYNKKLYCVNPVDIGWVWIEDKEQWVEKDDARISVTAFAGNKIHYASSTEWIHQNYGVTQSNSEDRLVIISESITVRFAGNFVRQVSRFERLTTSDYFNCVDCGMDCYINISRDDHRCYVCVEQRARSAQAMPDSGIYPYSHRVERELGFDDSTCVHIGGQTKPIIGKDGKPIPINKNRKGQPVYLGVELEYNIPERSRRESASYIHGTRYARCKSDGTVQGYEIVSKPCGIETHRGFITDILTRFGSTYDPGKNCGIHVHVSREPFTNAEIGRVLGFIHREHNRDFILGIARRESHQYARFSDSFIKEHKRNPDAMMKTVSCTNPHDSRHIYDGKKLAHHDTTLQSKVRYTALNVKDKTLEFRLFGASKEVETVMACLEFCEALMMYAHLHSTHTNESKVASLSIKEWLDVKNFIEFVNNYKVKLDSLDEKGKTQYTLKYPSLNKYIVDSKLVTSSKDLKEIWLAKVTRSFIDRINPVDKHREVPTAVQERLIEQLLASPFTMTRWLSDRNNMIMYVSVRNRWELLAPNGSLILAHLPESTEIEVTKTAIAEVA